MRSAPLDVLRLAFGTLSIYPTKPPGQLDRRAAGWAMTSAPFVGAALAGPPWLVSTLVDTHLSAIVLAALWLVWLAVATRALHLDGLADTADGLGSGKPAAQALDIMRRSDIGPFGVVTLALVLLVDATAATQLLSERHGAAVVFVAVVQSRLLVPLCCAAWVPSARPEGLGAAVATSVTTVQVLLAAALTVVISVVVAAAVDGPTVGQVLTGLVGVVVGAAFLQWCVRRLGGMTGDVIGACTELALAASLVALCWR